MRIFIKKEKKKHHTRPTNANKPCQIPPPPSLKCCCFFIVNVGDFVLSPLYFVLDCSVKESLNNSTSINKPNIHLSSELNSLNTKTLLHVILEIQMPYRDMHKKC